MIKQVAYILLWFFLNESSVRYKKKMIKNEIYMMTTVIFEQFSYNQAHRESRTLCKLIFDQ